MLCFIYSGCILLVDCFNRNMFSFDLPNVSLPYNMFQYKQRVTEIKDVYVSVLTLADFSSELDGPSHAARPIGPAHPGFYGISGQAKFLARAGRAAIIRPGAD